jgi:hypothetical protein
MKEMEIDNVTILVHDGHGKRAINYSVNDEHICHITRHRPMGEGDYHSVSIEFDNDDILEFFYIENIYYKSKANSQKGE